MPKCQQRFAEPDSAPDGSPSPTTRLQRDAAWLSRPDDLSAAQAHVVARYLHRLQFHRTMGGLIGVMLAAVIGLRWEGQFHLFALGAGSPLGNIAYCGVAGIVVGALSAETYRLRLPIGATATASLVERRLDIPRWRNQARLLVAASVVVAIIALALGYGGDSLLTAVLGAGVAGVGEATHRAIETRRRPVLSDDALAVDHLLRQFAVVASARLQLSAAILTAGSVAARLDVSSRPALIIRTTVTYGALLAAALQLHRSAPRGPRPWRPQS